MPLWGLLLPANRKVVEAASRMGITKPGWIERLTDIKLVIKAIKAMIQYRSIAPVAILTPEIGWAEKMFNEIIKHPEGLWIVKVDSENNMKEIQTDDGKIHIHIPEMEEWIKEITPEQETQALFLNSEFPMTLSAGRHIPYNANTLMRKPDWNRGKQTCTLAMNPEDAVFLDITDDENVKLTTESASVEIELEITDETRKCKVLLESDEGCRFFDRLGGFNSLKSTGQ